jgi:hypothetical protein
VHLALTPRLVPTLLPSSPSGVVGRKENRMNPARAFLSGSAAGAVMSLFMAVARAAGIPIELELMLGTLGGVEPCVATWAMGFMIHLLLSGFFGVLYGLGFDYVTHRAGFRVGMLLSIAHMALLGLLIGALAQVHPLMPLVLPSPGMFLRNFGQNGLLAFLMVHLVYGATIGALYRRATTEWPEEVELPPEG